MRKTLFCLMIFLIPACLRAQSGETSFEFMLIGASSRAASMAEAFTAVGDDASSPFFNPATLGLGKRTEFAFTHISYFNDVTQEAFNLASGSRGFRSGLAIYYGAVNDIERRADFPSEDPLGTFDEHNFTASYIWSIPIKDKFMIGNSLKWSYEKIDIEDASAVALDFGGVYSLNSETSIGVSLRNVGTKPKFISQAFDLPREFRFGASYSFPENSPLAGSMGAADFIMPHWGDKDIKLNIGAEYLYQKLIAIRLGYGIGYETRGFAAGAGIIYQNYFFDYAYTPAKHNLNDMHRFTLRARI